MVSRLFSRPQLPGQLPGQWSTMSRQEPKVEQLPGQLPGQWSTTSRQEPKVVFKYLEWEALDVLKEFLPCQVLEQKFPNVLVPAKRKKKVLYISHRVLKEWDPDPDNKSWHYLKEQRSSLSKLFDGFFYDFSCMYQYLIKDHEGQRKHAVLTTEQRDARNEQLDQLSTFIKKCYVMVVDPYDVWKDRFWILWECLNAAKNRKLVVNDYVIPLLEKTGPNPNFVTVQKILLNAGAKDGTNKYKLLSQLETLYLEGAQCYLIPVDHFLSCENWDSVHPVPLSLHHIDQSKVLMISHRWETKKHPDPENTKLRIIQSFLDPDHQARDLNAKTPTTFQYIFFDWECVDQTPHKIESALVRVNELYANSPCLCICDSKGDYFRRSWCLFEICTNTFNKGTPIVLPKNTHHPILHWLKCARLVQQFGYVHVLEDMYQANGTTQLDLPEDQLHLKSQLRNLILSSTLTNQGDLRIILNLLDKLVPVPDE